MPCRAGREMWQSALGATISVGAVLLCCGAASHSTGWLLSGCGFGSVVAPARFCLRFFGFLVFLFFFTLVLAGWVHTMISWKAALLSKSSFSTRPLPRLPRCH